MLVTDRKSSKCMCEFFKDFSNKRHDEIFYLYICEKYYLCVPS